MKLAVNLLIIFTLVLLVVQCGGQPANTNQPQAVKSPDSTNQSKEVTGTSVKVGNLNYPVANGRSWGQLDAASKEIFLQGMVAGIVAVLQRSANDLDSKSTENLSWLMSAAKGHNIADIIQQINNFYSDSANINIPILEAYKYALFKFDGAKEEDLEKALSKLRSQYK